MVIEGVDDDGVYCMVHVTLLPEPERLHEAKLLNFPPVPPSLHDTVPVGVDAGEAGSVTVVLYVIIFPLLTAEGFGVTVVVVQSTGEFPVMVPEMVPQLLMIP